MALEIKLDGTALTTLPTSFTVTVLDLDNGESTVRTADGTLNRDRIAVKRQIVMEWGPLTWVQISGILSLMTDVFFDVYYPDPLTGAYATKTFYVGDRPAPSLMYKNNVMLWSGLKITLTEK